MDFAPFVVREDGETLALYRPKRLGDLVMRGLYYLMLVLPLALIVLIGYALATRPTSVGGVVFCIIAVPLLLGVMKLMLLAFRLDGVRWITAGPQGVQVQTQGAFGKRIDDRISRPDIERVVGQPKSMKPRANLRRQWWYEVVVAGADQRVSLGWFAMGGEDDETPRVAARAIAARLGVDCVEAEA